MAEVDAGCVEGEAVCGGVRRGTVCGWEEAYLGLYVLSCLLCRRRCRRSRSLLCGRRSRWRMLGGRLGFALCLAARGSLPYLLGLRRPGRGCRWSLHLRTGVVDILLFGGAVRRREPRHPELSASGTCLGTVFISYFHPSEQNNEPKTHPHPHR